MDPSKAPGERSGYVGGLPHAAVIDYSYDGTMRSFEQSLLRLGLDRIDILLIHDVDVWTHGAAAIERRFGEAMDGAYRALDQLRSAEGDFGHRRRRQRSRNVRALRCSRRFRRHAAGGALFAAGAAGAAGLPAHRRAQGAGRAARRRVQFRHSRHRRCARRALQLCRGAAGHHGPRRTDRGGVPCPRHQRSPTRRCSFRSPIPRSRASCWGPFRIRKSAATSPRCRARFRQACGPISRRKDCSRPTFRFRFRHDAADRRASAFLAHRPRRLCVADAGARRDLSRLRSRRSGPASRRAWNCGHHPGAGGADAMPRRPSCSILRTRPRSLPAWSAGPSLPHPTPRPRSQGSPPIRCSSVCGRWCRTSPTMTGSRATELAPAFEAMIAHRLVFDALLKPRHLRRLIAVLERHPQLRVVDRSCGQARDREWLRCGMAERHRRRRAISGGRLQALRPCHRGAGQLDGRRSQALCRTPPEPASAPERLIWGSDWPVVNLAADYGSWLSTAGQLMAGLDATAQSQVFGGNAAGMYLSHRGKTIPC